jgi:hypothetical protein
MGFFSFSRRELIWGGLIGLVLGLVAGYFIWKEVQRPSLYGLLRQEWVKNVIGKPALVLESPEPLEIATDPAGASLNGLIRNMVTAGYVHEEGFSIQASVVSYVAGLEPERDAAADGFLNELKHLGVSDLEFSRREGALGKQQGLVQKGQFKDSGGLKQFENHLLVSGDQLWMLTLTYPSDHPAGPELCRRVVESVELVME